MQFWRSIQLCIVAIAFLGCVVPVKNTFFYLERPGSTHSKDSVNGSPSIIYFEYHEIWLSATIQPSCIQIGIHVPGGQTAQLLSNTIELSQNVNGPESHKYKLDLRPVPGDYKNITPVNFMLGYKHDFDVENCFGVLSGGTTELSAPLSKKIICHKGYFYKAYYVTPRKAGGTLNLPDLKINGIFFPGPSISFKEEKEIVMAYAGP